MPDLGKLLLFFGLILVVGGLVLIQHWQDRNQISAIAHRRSGELLKTELRGEERLVIGDTPLDVECGRAIGAKVLAVATGNYSMAELREYQPDWAVEDLTKISAREICPR